MHKSNLDTVERAVGLALLVGGLGFMALVALVALTFVLLASAGR